MEGLRRAGENPDVFTQTENLNRLLKELTEQDRTGLFLLRYFDYLHIHLDLYRKGNALYQ